MESLIPLGRPGTMRGRQRKSLRFQAASLPGRDTTIVKDEIYDEKPCTPNVVLPGHCTVKVESGDDGEVKPNISAEHKMVHNRSRQVRRRHPSDSRYEYIMSVAQRMKSSPANAVPGVGERLFHNAFKCLIDAIVASQTKGTNDRLIEVDIDGDAFDSLEPLENREYYLEKILTLLLCVARIRVYNPPSDNEVVYYREIKKHIRCMIAYCEARGNTKDALVADSKDPAGYHSMSCSQTISAVEELIELSGILADISPHICDLNHKSDLPPDGSEKKALDALVDYVAFSSTHVMKVDKMAGSSDVRKHITTTTRKRQRETCEVMLFAAGVHKTNGLFDGRLFEYVHELRMSCLSFMLKLMEKVGTVVYPQNLHRRFGMEATEVINQWMNKEKVNPERSPKYIEGIDECIVLARYAAALIKGISSSVHDAFANLTDMLRRDQHWYEFGPEALRVLSLLDCGAFRKAEDKMEIPLHAVSSSDVTKTKDDRVISLESDADNLKVLATILHVLKDIGPLDAFVAPSPREAALLEQILEHVSLCIDGFLSTKAYLVERELTVAPASALVADWTMHRINKQGIHRGSSLEYFVHGGKYLVESLSEDFERVHEDVEIMIPSLQKYKVLVQNV